MPHLDHEKIPGPVGLPILGNALEFGRDPLGFLAKTSTYGPIASMRLYTRPFYLVHSPELIQQGLVANARKTRKDDLFDHIRRALGNGLATSEGPFWHRQRIYFARSFTPRAVASHADTIVDSVLSSLDRWTDGQLLDLHEAASRVTLEVVSRSFFGQSVQDEALEVFEALKSIGDYYVTALASPVHLPPWAPLPSNVRFVRSVGRIRSIVKRLIERRRHTGPTGDLLSDLLFGRDGEPSGMSETEILDECMTLFVAGHETSGLALLYTLQLLLGRPDVETELRDEIEQVLAGRRPTASDVQRLERTEQVVRESMRLHPPAWITVRHVLEELELGGHVIPTGSALMFSPWVTHRNPRYFPSPEEFIPSRWANGTMRSIPRYAYIPFGAGPRACLGNHFAMTELILAVATLLQRAELTLEQGQTIRHSLSVTLRPKQPVGVRLRKVIARNRSAAASQPLQAREPKRYSSRPPAAAPSPISRLPHRRDPACGGRPGATMAKSVREPPSPLEAPSTDE